MLVSAECCCWRQEDKRLSPAELGVPEKVPEQELAGSHISHSRGCVSVQEVPLGCADRDCVRNLPLHNFLACVAAVQREGGTTCVAQCCQGAVREAWGFGLEHTNGWITVSSPVEDFGAQKAWAARDSA